MEIIPNLAFPQAYENNNSTITHFGLTKREYFACHIATGLSVQAIAGSHNGIKEMEVDVPFYAVRLADALLAELENKK
jgi:hypothetical protein